MTPPFTVQHPTTCLRSFTNQATVTDPAGHTTTFAYNGRGERISTTTALGLVTTETLDLNGNSIQTTRPDSSVITRTYDALNRLISETDAAGDTIAYTYTARGPLATITDSRGAVTTFQYDLKDRLTAKVYDDTSSETSAYNAKDQLTAFTTARGITRTYTYDNRDRLTGVSYSDATPAVSFTYNAAGERLSANNSVAAVAHSYDAAGRTIAETHNITGHPLGARTLNLQHDVDSRLTRITYPDASQVAYGYDQRGRLATVTGAAFSVAYTRSLDSLVTGMSFSNGITSSRVYDADHRLLDIAYSQGSTVVSKAAYDLNSLGLRTRVERANGLGDNFGYDAKDQVVAVDYESAAPATAGLGSSTFNYDAMGNRTALSQQLVGGTLQNETYTANLLNQYTAIGSDSPVHDADGNLTSQGGALLTYDGENRVTSITPALPVNGDQRLSYSYDALGRRVAKGVETYQSGAWLPSTQTNYLYWDWNVLEEHRSVVVGAVSTHRYIWGEDLSGTFQGAGGVGGLLLQEVSGGTHAGARWFSHYDGNGNITELSDNAGNVVASYRYAVFGESMSATGPAATANIYRFSTKPLDVELASNSHTSFSEGLYYYGYRFYDPQNGRWINRDPIGEDGGLNLYAMVGNTVVNTIDVLGLSESNCCGGQPLRGRQKCCGDTPYTPGRNGGKRCCGGTIYSAPRSRGAGAGAKEGDSCCKNSSVGTYKPRYKVEGNSLRKCISDALGASSIDEMAATAVAGAVGVGVAAATENPWIGVGAATVAAGATVSMNERLAKDFCKKLVCK